MNQNLVSRTLFRASTIGLAAALLFGCGGDDNSSEQTQRPSSVLVSETATILSVRTEMPSSDASGKFEAQALNYTFAAQINSGPNAGLSMTGRLELKGEREDDGVTEVEGRLYPDVSPTVPAGPSDKELAKKFEADRKDLKRVLRVDLKLLSDELNLALKNGAVRGSQGPSAAQKQALATFRTKFDLRMDEYRAAMSVLIAEYRTARHHGQSGGEDDDNDAAKGYEVHGSIGVNGAIELQVKFGDKGIVRAVGTIAADGPASGSLTGPGQSDQGTWTATATDVVTPPATDCATQAVSWSQGTSICNAAYTGGTNGSTAALADILAPTTGTATASCSSGVLAMTNPLCATTAPPPPTNCAAQAMTWSQGASTCNAAYGGGISGSSAALSDIVAPTTGTATASCSSGTVSVTTPLCTTAAPPPPPTACAAQAVTWSQGASTCNGAYAGGISGSSNALSDIVAPTTGTATASCTGGVLAVTTPLCTTAAPPPPAACAAQAVTWTQGTSSCNASYAGGTSGSNTALSDIVAPTTGTVTASCTSGALAMTAPLCTTAAPPPPVGTFAAGKVKYDASCGSCHAAGSTYDPTGIANLAGTGGLLVSNLGNISGGMSGMLLTAQEILDLKVFLAGVQ